jgi:hypothetical protein
MKKVFLLAIFLIVVVVLPAFVSAGEGEVEIPKNGEISGKWAGAGPPLQIIAANGPERYIVLGVPVMPYQVKEDNLDLASATWQAYAHVADYTGSEWVRHDKEDFSVPTKNPAPEKPYLIRAKVKLLDYGWNRVRAWAGDKVSGKWLWPYENSPYARGMKRDKNELAYELLVHLTPEGEVKKEVVPENYPLW